jgi:hypothetical protein
MKLHKEAMRNAITTRDFSFIEKYTPLLIYRAILLSGIDIHSDDIEIATGLSLLNWKDKDKYNLPTKEPLQIKPLYLNDKIQQV